MNLNHLVLGNHVEFEAQTYIASFNAEVQAAATPMWTLVSHLKDEKTRDYTANVLKYCLAAIREWWDAIHYDSPKIVSLLYTRKLSAAWINSRFGSASD